MRIARITTPFTRSRRQTIIIQSYHGSRPRLDKLQDENRELKQRIRDLDLRVQLASNNPGSALYPTIREYLGISEQYTLLQNKFDAANEEERPTIERAMNEMRPSLLRAHDTMTEAMHKYVERRIKGLVPRIPLLTVEA